VAQDTLNKTLGLDRVAALHMLIQESMELLVPAETGEPDALRQG
jgi:hypothetical protein